MAVPIYPFAHHNKDCLLYTSDAADERSSVDLGGRRIIKKKNSQTHALFRTIDNYIPYNSPQHKKLDTKKKQE